MNLSLRQNERPARRAIAAVHAVREALAQVRVSAVGALPGVPVS